MFNKSKRSAMFRYMMLHHDLHDLINCALEFTISSQIWSIEILQSILYMTKVAATSNGVDC